MRLASDIKIIYHVLASLRLKLSLHFCTTVQSVMFSVLVHTPWYWSWKVYIDNEKFKIWNELFCIFVIASTCLKYSSFSFCWLLYRIQNNVYVNTLLLRLQHIIADIHIGSEASLTVLVQGSVVVVLTEPIYTSVNCKISTLHTV